MDSYILSETVKVLMIDKDDQILQDVGELFQGKYEYVNKSTSDEVMKYLKEYNSQIAMILIHMECETVDPLDILKKFKESDLTNAIPIIAMSHSPHEAEKSVAYNLGVTDYLDLTKKRASAAMRVRNMLKVYLESRASQLYQAECDPLTGLLNQQGLRRRFEERLRLEPKEQYIVIYTDLKNFKYFNSLFGFDEGNRLLKFWCDTIKKYCKEDDLICRISGDRVVIIIPQDYEGQTQDYFCDILAEVREHFANDYGNFTINIVSGVYHYKLSNNRGETFDQLIGFARQAQKSIKNTEISGRAVFDDKMWNDQIRKMEINGRVETALANGEIYLNLQPQYNCVTGEIIGAECLCRWMHETQGFISPAEFIPALEESGKIYDVDFFVWETACRYIRKWLDEGITISLSVNISRKDVEKADLPEVFIGLINKYNLTPDLLRLEITETAYMDDAGRLTELIRRFSQAGFTVEMDDFGSGFSSLNLLHKTDVDVLKLDMGFLDDDGDEKGKSSNIINAMVKMAHAMDMKVLAEGVETEEQAAFLKDIGCLQVQGYYFSRPISVDDFESLIRTSKIEGIQENYDKYQTFNFHELFDKKSSGYFIFNNCMGAAALFEFDKEKILPVVFNDHFAAVFDFDKEEIEHNGGAVFGMMSGESQKKILDMVDKAYKYECVSDEIYSTRTGKTLFVFMRYITTRDNKRLFFVETNDISKEKELEQKMKELQYNQALQKKWYDEKVHALLSMPGTVLYDYNPLADMMVVTVNRENGQIVERYAENYLVNLHEKSWVHAEDIAEYIATIRKVVASGEHKTVETRAIFADGKYKKCYFDFTPVTDNEGKVYRVVGRAKEID